MAEKPKLPKKRNPFVEGMRQKLRPKVIPSKKKIIPRKEKHNDNSNTD